MNIVFVINDLGGGGAERVVQQLSNYFAKQHDVTIVMLRDVKQEYEVDEKVKIIKLKSGSLAKLPGGGILMPVQAFELGRLLKRLKPDAVISSLLRANWVHVMSKYLGNKYPILLCEQNSAVEKFRSKRAGDKIGNILIRRLYPKADRILAVSGGVKNSLVRDYGLDDGKVDVVFNPQNIDEVIKQSKMKSKELSDLPLDESAFKIITIGSLTPQKDQQMLLQAFTKLLEKGHEAQLVILGKGPLGEELKALSEELGIEDKVVWAGHKKNPFNIMSACDIFALSSKFEGLPLVMVEALACGMPILSTDCVSGPTEILKGGECGILTPVGDAQKFSESMEKLLKDEKLRVKYSNLAKARAKDFDVSVIGEQYIDFFKRT